jgi:hypothetical protein
MNSYSAPASTHRPYPHGPQEYKGNGKHEWERVAAEGYNTTDRLRVPGGWLYRTVEMSFSGAEVEAMNTVFVPVPNVVGYAL